MCCSHIMKIWILIQTDIQDTDSYSYSYSLFQVFSHSNPLFDNNIWALRPLTRVYNQIWHKQWHIHLLLGKSFNIVFNNLYLHTKAFNMKLKSNFYLMSVSDRVQLNPSRPIFPNKNLTQKMTSLHAGLRINQKWLR